MLAVIWPNDGLHDDSDDSPAATASHAVSVSAERCQQQDDHTHPQSASIGAHAAADYRVLMANLGDSRGLLVHHRSRVAASASEAVSSTGPHHRSDISGEPMVLEDLQLLAETVDHKPDLPKERDRILAAGGMVTADMGEGTDGNVNRGGLSIMDLLSSNPGVPRVDDDLALSRAFGDFRLKDCDRLPPEQQKVSPLPDVGEYLCNQGDFLVLACDGAFDVLESTQVAAIAARELLPGVNNSDGNVAELGSDESRSAAERAARAVVREALLRGTMDNVTCVVVLLEGHVAAAK